MVKNKKDKKSVAKKTSKEIKEEGFENSFIREVNEDVQQDRFNDLAKKYGMKVAVFCGIIILFVVAQTIYINLHNKSVMKEAGEFQIVVNKVDDLLVAKNISEAKNLVRDFVSSANYDYKDIAYTMLFELSLKEGGEDLSLLLEEMRENANTSKVRDFAEFNYAIIEFEKNSDLDLLIENLSSLLKNRKSYFNENSYLVAISAALSVENFEVAKKFVANLERKKNLSENIKSQLDGLKKIIEVKS